MASSKVKATQKEIVQRGPPYSLRNSLGPSCFSFDIGDPVGGPLPTLKTRGANDDQAPEINYEMDIGVTDDGITFEKLKTEKEPKKRSASISEPPKPPSKKIRVPGGRPPLPKRVTAQLDSDDEIIVSMKKAGKSCSQIAKRLREEGRINYRDKTITSRYVRIMNAQAKQMERDAASAHTHWEGEDLEALVRAVVAVDSQILRETEKLTRRKWQLVVSHLRASRPEGIFSKAECERTYNQLVGERQPNANDLEFQSKASASQPSTFQPDNSQPDVTNAGSGESDGGPSPQPATDSEDYDGGSSEAGDDVCQVNVPQGENICDKATIGRNATSGANGNTAKDVAKVAAILNRGLRATAQKSQENATSGPSSEQYEPVTSTVSVNGINEAEISADNATIPLYNDAPETATIDPSAVIAPTIISGLAVATSEITTSPKYVEHDNYTVGRMLVCGREVPEPAAMGRRLLVQNLPCWVTLTEIQIIFQEFNFLGSICEDCDEGCFVDVATANDARRAAATLNKQLIMNEIISVTVYRHPHMVGFDFGQWPMVFDLDRDSQPL